MKLTQSKFGKNLMPLFAFFNVINIAFFLWGDYWDSIKINHTVVIFGNALLFLLAMIALWLHMNASKKENPNVLVRSIMTSTFLKMIVVAVSVLIYVKTMKEQKSKLAIFVTMAIYLIYMLLELKIALQLNKKQASNARN